MSKQERFLTAVLKEFYQTKVVILEIANNDFF